MCSVGISLSRSKLHLSSSYFSLKLEIEKAVIAWSAGRNTMEVFYTAFFQASSGDSCQV